MSNNILTESLHSTFVSRILNNFLVYSRHNKMNNNLGNEKNNVACRIDELGDDVLTLILSRITSWKLLVQCRSVSKRWNIIISQPEFLRRLSLKFSPFTLYLESRTMRTSIISEHPYFQSQNLPFRFDFTPSDKHEFELSVVGSYSDLLIFYRNIPYPKTEKPHYIICNPITRKYLQLVEDPYWYDVNGNARLIGLAGNLEGVSTNSVKVEGDGDGDGDGGFRFVRIVAQEVFQHTVEVFSSETGKWSIYANVIDFSFWSLNSVTLNNKLHWLGHDGILVIDPFSDDITQYRIIKTPRHYLCEFGVCQERLRLAELSFDYRDNSTTLTVWELEDYDDDETWAVMYSKTFNNIFLNGVHPSFMLGQCQIKAISFHPCDGDVVYLVNDNNRVFRYNLKNGTFKLVLDHHDQDLWRKLFPLVNPLVAP